jgi:hypothetical protein
MTGGNLAPGVEDTQTRASLVIRTWRVGQKIAKDPAGVASVIALLLGGVVSLIPLYGSLVVAVHSVGYAVVGGAAFSLIYKFWANEALVEVISRKINIAHECSLQELKRAWHETADHSTSAFSRYAAEMAEMHRRHWPLDVYPEGSEPNRSFNER